MRKFLFSLLAALPLFVACTSDDSEESKSPYTFLCADFVEAHTIAPTEIDRATNDEGVLLKLSPHVKVSWALTPDSLYRALLYYNKVESLDGTIVPITLARVPVLRAKEASEFEDGVKTDPVKLESAWLSKGNAYLNLGLLLKTGVADDSDAVQSVGMVLVSETATEVVLRLYHDQGGVPQYYSSRSYVSIPLSSDRQQKTVRLLINTYDGEREKTFN